MKKFLCVQGSPEIPKGTIAEWQGIHERYWLYHTESEFDGKGIVVDALKPWQVENNECWEEVIEETKEEDKPTRWKPKMGQPFYCLDESGFVEEDEWDGTLFVQRKWDTGNCFRTEQDACDEVKRRESIANAWRPMEGEWCWIWDFTRGGAGNICYNTNFLLELYIGAIHPTEEACLDWGETDAHLFLPKTA